MPGYSAAPQLDSTCHYPWFKVAGCRGKSTDAMLRLTNSAFAENDRRLREMAAWYANVRQSYRAGAAK